VGEGAGGIGKTGRHGVCLKSVAFFIRVKICSHQQRNERERNNQNVCRQIRPGQLMKPPPCMILTTSVGRRRSSYVW